MWSSTVGLVNGKHRYLTAETFGFKVNSNGQVLKKRQQWTIEPFPENLGPDGSISSAASVSSQYIGNPQAVRLPQQQQQQQQQQLQQQNQHQDPSEACILTCFSPNLVGSSLTSIKSSSNGSSSTSSSTSDHDACGEEHENVAIKSHLNKYLAVDSFGNVTCDSDEKTENARFTITICSMSQGRSKDEHIFWAFKNVERGYYLGTTEDGMICCKAKMPKSRAELWHLHLIPARGASFFALKSLGRKRFARVVDELTDSRPFVDPLSASSIKQHNKHTEQQCQVQLDATISWGPETLFQFKYYDGGRYALLTSDCMYLTNEGKCVQWPDKLGHPSSASSASNGLDADSANLPPPECLFTLEYHSGFLAFRDSFSHYLAAAGRSSVLRSRSIGVSRDELFVFESAPIQVSLKATFNNRWVSVKQGVDLSANQTEATLKFETFQLTYHKQTQNWSIMTHDCNFWTVSHNTSTISVCKPGDYEGLTRGQFKLTWSNSDATCSLKFIDANRQERWIAARKSGQLYLGSGALAATNGNQVPVKFIMRFQNRKSLNLRPVDGTGFVGLKATCSPGSGNTSRQLEANKTSPDSIAIEYSDLPEQLMSSTNLSGANMSGGVLTPLDESAASVRHNNCTNMAPKRETSQQTVNMFNVKLQSTKIGSQSVLDRLNGDNRLNQAYSNTIMRNDMQHTRGPLKEIDDCIDDNNNNNCVLSTTNANQMETTMSMDENGGKMDGGSVESASAPSVAAIINSFSNAKIRDQISNSSQIQVSANGRSIGSSVSKLASTFNNVAMANQNQQNQLSSSDCNSDTASVITSCSSVSSSASANSTVLSHEQQRQQHGLDAHPNHKQPIINVGFNSPDQIAQVECCYLKLVSNDRYLAVGDNDSSVICDATNTVRAQSWIIELRSHNSIAIRASDNHAYMQLGTNGTIFLSRCEPREASLWEF